MLSKTVISNAVYKRQNLTTCAGHILIDYGFEDWKIIIDQRIPGYEMSIYNPQFISVQQALEEIAEAYFADIEVNEHERTIRFTYNPRLAYTGLG